MVRVADLVIQKLIDQGIKHIFLITGRGILYLTDAVAKNKEIEGVSTYHEQGASYAAMAYAALNDGMSACLVSTGCAATNAVTAALCAYQDNLPVIFISGQHMLQETTRFTATPIRTYGSQEADIIAIVESVTKYAVMLSDASQAAYEMDKAIYIANEGRKGPVWIDIPLDVQNARVEEGVIPSFKAENVEPAITDLSFLKNDLKQVRRPIIFAGGGVRSANATKELKEFAEKNSIPVVFSTGAADIYGTDNRISIGAVGSLGGSRAGNFAVQNADFILALGTKLCSQSVGDFKQFARDAKLVVVDIDQNEHSKKGVHIDRFINMDVKVFLNKMNQIHCTGDYHEWAEQCLHWKDAFRISNEPFVKELKEKNEIDIYQFANILSDEMAEDTVVITDAGLEELIIPSTIRYKGEQRCIFPAAQGAMGYAIPAIIGAYFAGKRNIVCVVGDGSFMMNMQELQLIGSLKMPAKIFVMNNNMYAVIRKRQQDLFRTRTIGNDPSDGLPAPDFKKIAYCFDIFYKNVIQEKDLRDIIRETLDTKGPVLCEVKCVEDQKYFHTSFAINKKKRLVKRPLEDLSPFLDREVFYKEMLIDPIKE